MRRIVHTLVLAAALLCLIASTSFARPGKAARADGRTARAAVIKNYQAKGRSTNIRVHKVRDSRSGKSSQLLVETKGSGKVRALNFRKSNGVAYETRTGLVSQRTARGVANQKLRRQNGTFSGVNSSGLSRSGKTYRFNSATDRRAKTGDSVYVSPKNGRAIHFVRGK